MPYKAFISYSHSAEGDFADALHDAMEKLAKPWNKRRARRVVLDKTAMAAGSSLGETINEKLAESEWLVLLATPESAQSKWCDDEIDYWKEHKSMDNVVIALTGGDIAVDPMLQRINWESSPSLSPRFRAAVGDNAVPLFEDLRLFKQDLDHANLRNTLFRDEVAKIVGRIEGVDPGELASQDKREYARTVRLRRAAELGLLLLTVAAVFFGVRAVLSERRAVEQEMEAIAQADRADQNAAQAEANAKEAEANAKEAEENAVEAQANAEQARREANRAVSSALASQAIAASAETPDLAALMALESVRIAPTVDAFISVVDSVVSATHFVWRTTVPDEPIVGAAAWHEEGGFTVMGTEFGDVLLVTPDDPEITTISIGEEFIAGIAVVDGTNLVRTIGIDAFDDSFDGWITTLNLDTGATTDIPVGPIEGGAISADGSTVAILVPLEGDEYEIIVLNAEGEEIDFIPLDGPPGFDCGVCLALSEDGSEVAWVETDPVFFTDVVWTWNVDTGRVNDVFETDGYVAGLAMTPSGNNVLIGDDLGEGFLVPVAGAFVEDPDPILVSGAEILTYSFAEPDDGAPLLLVTGHLNGSVGIWSLDEAAASADLVADLTRHNDEVRSVVASGDGAHVLSGGWDGDIISWRAVPTANHGVITPDAHLEEVMDITFVGDDETVASVGFDGVIRLWDASSRGALAEIDATDVQAEDQLVLYSIDADEDGRLLAVGGTFFELDEDGNFVEDGIIDDFVTVFDVDSGEEVATIGDLFASPASISFSPDGRHLAIGLSSGPVMVWATSSLGGEPLLELDAYAVTSGGVAFSGDSRFLAAATLESGGTDVGVWDIASGRLVVTATGSPVASVSAVALNGDGSILAWGDDTRLLWLWSIPDNAQIGENLTGHREPISDLEFADVDRDGVDGLLVSTSNDATTRVWEIRARRLVARIEAHTADVTAVAVSPNANLIVTSSQDQSIWVGDLDPETWVDAACDLAGRNMTQEEWDALQLEDDYVRHCAAYPPGDGAPEDSEAWTFTFTGVDTGEETPNR